jgi:hypothetical protein
MSALPLVSVEAESVLRLVSVEAESVWVSAAAA